MKKAIIVLLAMLIWSVSADAANYFIQRDNLGILQKYEVNEKFLHDFAWFVRTQNNEYKPFLTDIYNALEAGYTVTYNKDANTIDGMDGYNWSSLTAKELKRMRGKESDLSATLNTKKHRFYMALTRLYYFSMGL